MPSAPVLGVAVMDRDHAALDRLFDAAATTADSELPALLDTIAQDGPGAGPVSSSSFRTSYSAVARSREHAQGGREIRRGLREAADRSAIAAIRR